MAPAKTGWVPGDPKKRALSGPASQTRSRDLDARPLGGAHQGSAEVEIDGRLTLASMEHPQIWGFRDEVNATGVELAVRKAASRLTGDASRIIIMTGAHGTRFGRVADQDLSLAEDDYLRNLNILNKSKKPVTVQIWPINPFPGDHMTIGETNKSSAFFNDALKEAKAAIIESGDPKNTAIILGYCHSAMNPNLRR